MNGGAIDANTAPFGGGLYVQETAAAVLDAPT